VIRSRSEVAAHIRDHHVARAEHRGGVTRFKKPRRHFRYSRTVTAMPCRSSIRPVYLPQPHACEGVSRNPGISQYSARTRATSASSGGIGTRVGDSEPAFVLQPVLDLAKPPFTGPQHRGAAMPPSTVRARGRGRGRAEPPTQARTPYRRPHGNRSRLRTTRRSPVHRLPPARGQEGGRAQRHPAHRMVQHLTKVTWAHEPRDCAVATASGAADDRTRPRVDRRRRC